MEGPQGQERDFNELYGDCAGNCAGLPCRASSHKCTLSSHCGARLLQTFSIYQEANLLNSLLGKSSSSDRAQTINGKHFKEL